MLNAVPPDVANGVAGACTGTMQTIQEPAGVLYQVPYNVVQYGIYDKLYST